jgi:hypothetical protein
MTRKEFIEDFRAARLAAKFKPTAPTPVGRACVAARRAKPVLPFILRWDRHARSTGVLYEHMQAFELALKYKRRWANGGAR